jgi:putative membrane protein
MEGRPYGEFSPEQLVLRDHLAVERTVLANERTLLAYVRTALAVLVVAASLIKFFKTEFFEVIGWVLIPVGLALIVLGVLRYRAIAACIRGAECAQPRAPRE